MPPETNSKILLQDRAVGAWTSSDYLERGPFNAVIIEATAKGTSPSADLQVLDSANSSAAYNATVDSAGLKTGMTGYTKWLVAGVLDYIKVLLTVSAGTWSVRVTRIEATNQESITAVVTSASVNLNEYAGSTVGPSNPVDVQDTATHADLATLHTDNATIEGDIVQLHTDLTSPTPAGTNVIGKTGIDQTTPGTTNHVEAATNARRDGGTLHRNAITGADVLAAAGTLTLTGVTDAGASLVSGTTYYVAVVPYNRWGPAGSASIATANASPGGANNALNVAFAAVTGADGFDIFLSVDAAPKWVARITEAQRATGGIITTVGGAPAAGGATNSIDMGVPGTGVQTSADPFKNNNAYTPASVTPIGSAGKSKAHVLVKLAVTDLRSLPALKLLPFFQNQLSAGDWHNGALQAISLLASAGETLEQSFDVDVSGSTGLAILIDTISGQGAAASVWVDLS